MLHIVLFFKGKAFPLSLRPYPPIVCSSFEKKRGIASRAAGSRRDARRFPTLVFERCNFFLASQPDALESQPVWPLRAAACKRIVRAAAAFSAEVIRTQNANLVNSVFFCSFSHAKRKSRKFRVFSQFLARKTKTFVTRFAFCVRMTSTEHAFVARTIGLQAAARRGHTGCLSSASGWEARKKLHRSKTRVGKRRASRRLPAARARDDKRFLPTDEHTLGG